MDLRITPGGRIEGETRVPGDKSIAHRWLMLAATARGRSELIDLPPSLDVRSTARVMGALLPNVRPPLELWADEAGGGVEGGGSTWNHGDDPPASSRVELEGEGRRGWVAPASDLDCGNSGTTMRLVCGLVASAGILVRLTGDESLRSRPMDRVVEPLRRMGARVDTTDGHAPVTLDAGHQLAGIVFTPERPSAQVKSAVLLAGLDADGATVVEERVLTRDHTERVLTALDAPIERRDSRVEVHRFQHDGFTGRVPGDPSSAAFLVVAAALTGGALAIHRVGLNPTRLHHLDVMRRMGVRTVVEVDGEEMGEPYGTIVVEPAAAIVGTRIEPGEIPLVIDEVPALAALAAHARGETWFLGAGELRVKESDRLDRVASGLRDLGGHAADEGDDLVIAGGGLDGGIAGAGGDHRIAMALAVAGLGAMDAVTVRGAEAAEVSFPGFGRLMAALGARIEAA